MGVQNGTSTTSIDPESLGQAIRAKRLEIGLSQRELAELLCIDRSGVSRLEAGNGLPSLQTLNRLADVLLVPVEELVSLARIFERAR